jgi:N-acetylglucosaminyldiphosphoundecaprenol N-acetyl-beta-D-mannosaminyltransferase
MQTRPAVARAIVLGCEIDRLTMTETIARCDELIHAGVQTRQVSVNAAKLVAIRRDAHLRALVARSQIVSADGQAVVWASRLLGHALPERVAGIDLMHALLDLAERKGYTVYFLGAQHDVLERAVARLQERFPRLRIAGYADGYFTDDEASSVLAEIRTAAPDMLFVGMSSPRKEQIVHSEQLAVPFAMGVGGSIDIVAGVVARAPRWAQRAGLEWSFRLAQDPRRLARRYLTTCPTFLLLVLRDVVRRRGRSLAVLSEP